MRNRLCLLGVAPSLLSLSLALGACTGSSTGDDDDVATTPTPTGTPTPGAVHITANTTWPATYALTETVIVDPGITLTVLAQTVVTASAGKSIQVQGVLDVQGVTTGAAVPSKFEAPVGTIWGGIAVKSGGQATLRNVEITRAGTGFSVESGALLSKVIKGTFTGISQPLNFAASAKVCRGVITGASGLSMVSGGTATLSDSNFSTGNNGDTVNLSGTGSLDIVHSHFGTGWHCLVHGGGSGTDMTVTKSVFDDAAYAFMIGAIPTATITDSRIEMGTGLAANDGQLTNVVNAANNYWGANGGYLPDGSEPTGWTVEPHSSSTDLNVQDAGVRADGTGCEVDGSF